MSPIFFILKQITKQRKKDCSIGCNPSSVTNIHKLRHFQKHHRLYRSSASIFLSAHRSSKYIFSVLSNSPLTFIRKLSESIRSTGSFIPSLIAQLTIKFRNISIIHPKNNIFTDNNTKLTLFCMAYAPFFIFILQKTTTCCVLCRLIIQDLVDKNCYILSKILYFSKILCNKTLSENLCRLNAEEPVFVSIMISTRQANASRVLM